MLKDVGLSNVIVGHRSDASSYFINEDDALVERKFGTGCRRASRRWCVGETWKEA